MKFGKKIQAVSLASTELCEASQWMDYKCLKKLLGNIGQTESSPSKKRKLEESNGEKAFFRKLLLELKKVKLTFEELEGTGIKRFLSFAPKLINFKEHVQSQKQNNQALSPERCSEILKQAAEVHLNFVLLENYSVMNYCGFTKILKKHDKVTGFSTREKYMLKMVNEQPFAKHVRVAAALKVIAGEMENLKKIVLNLDEEEKKVDESGEDTGVGMFQNQLEQVIRERQAVRKATNALAAENCNPGAVRMSSEGTNIRNKKNRDRLESLVNLLEDHVVNVTKQNEAKRVKTGTVSPALVKRLQVAPSELCTH